MKRHKLTPTGIIMLGFLIGAFLGAFCLLLPISLRQGQKIDSIDALFVAMSSICVTGLSTVNIGQTFSAFGQVVLLLLIQFGGLGIVTFTTIVLCLFRRRITLAERIVIQSAYNLDTLSGLVRLTMRILKVTLCLEGLGAIGYSLVFIPEYGLKGIWYSIFHAVSAFCNAGIDLLGGNSFCGYTQNGILNFTTIFLIIVSGLGFPVYWEIVRAIRPSFQKKGNSYVRKMNLQAKIVLLATISLILAGTLLTLLFEYDNPDTLGGMSWPQKRDGCIVPVGDAAYSRVCHHSAGVFQTFLLPGLSDPDVHRRLPGRYRRGSKNGDGCSAFCLHVRKHPGEKGCQCHAQKNCR